MLMSVEEKNARIKELQEKIEKVDYTTINGNTYFMGWLKEKEYIEKTMI